MKHLFLMGMVSCAMVMAKTAPSFQGSTIMGTRINLNDALKENKAVLLSFWASWCTPCIEELAQTEQHLSRHPELPLKVITVNVDTAETASNVAPAIRLNGIVFPVILDPNHEIFAKYQAERSLPFSVIINHDGAIVKTFNGYHDTMFDEITQAITAKR